MFRRQKYLIRARRNQARGREMGYKKIGRQRGRVVRTVVFATAMIARLRVLPTQDLLFRSWIRRLPIIISALVESDKQHIKEVRSKTQPGNSEITATPKRVWIRLMHSASVVFS